MVRGENCVIDVRKLEISRCLRHIGSTYTDPMAVLHAAGTSLKTSGYTLLIADDPWPGVAFVDGVQVPSEMPGLGVGSA